MYEYEYSERLSSIAFIGIPSSVQATNMKWGKWMVSVLICVYRHPIKLKNKSKRVMLQQPSSFAQPR